MKVLIVAGGTGGHLYPGIAVAKALKGHEVSFVVRRGDLCRDILIKEGFQVNEISGQGLPRTLSLKLLTFPFRFSLGWVEAWSLLKSMSPDRVVGMGGYLSAPVILLARFLGIKTLLHEQNVLPGLTNRLLSYWADSVAVSFQDSAAHLSGKKVWVSGLPVRSDIGTVSVSDGRKSFGLDEKTPTFLAFGGSLGAQRLNTLVVEAFKDLQVKGVPFQVIHVTGSKDFDRVQSLYSDLTIKANVLAYCHSMAHAYAASDAVICRAGASTVAELLIMQRPAFLVPYPFASDNHQVDNAAVIVKAGLGRMALEETLLPTTIADFLLKNVKTTLSKEAFIAPGSSTAASRLAAHLTAGN